MIRVEFYYDYSCPFCYVGSRRLLALARRYALDIRWRPLETHPELPAAGKPASEIGHTPEQWARAERMLAEMSEAESPPRLVRPDFVPNTRRALLLAQAALHQAPEHFRSLHEAIFGAYFEHGQNIGEPTVLMALAAGTGAAEALGEAWTGPQYVVGLVRHVQAAQEAQVSALPTLVVAGRSFSGAVSVEVLEQALQQHQDGA